MRLLPLVLLLTVHLLPAQSLVTYAGGSGEQRFWNVLELSDGTFLVCGYADDLSWLPGGTSTMALATTAANGSSIDNEGVDEGQVAFLIRYAADLSTILEVVHFPDGAADEIRFVKATTPPGQPTGDLYISGKRGKTSRGEKDGGFYIAKLNNNFIGGTPTGLEYVFNVPTHGKNDEHAKLQPWDVRSDGKVVTMIYGAYTDKWGQIYVLSDNPPTPASAEEYPAELMPGFRYHKLDDGSNFYGTMDEIPTPRFSTKSEMVLKTQRTTNSGLQRSFTFDDYHHWEKDENGYWRKGKYPLDAMWNNYWLLPETDGATNNMWGADARGYMGYKLAGTGGTEGSPYTPRVGVITVDKRNDHVYIGLNWKSRLPDSNNPDFEPAFIALDEEGYYKWWCRLYKEYNDSGATAPEAHHASVSSLASQTVITAASLAGTSINVSRVTTGSNGYINGYRRLFWKTGANAPGSSEISGYNETTGEITLKDAPANTITAGDQFMVDATVMTKTQTSTPDQYIDAIAIDYSQALSGEFEGEVIVGARAHGNNVTNFWPGDEITANPAATTYHNGFTGNNGNAHYTWIGRLRDDTSKATLLGCSWFSEFGETGDYGSGFGNAYTDPNMDFWPSHNAGWPDLNTTKIRQSMRVDSQGRVYVLAELGRATLTTKHAFQRNIRPVVKGNITAATSTTEFVVGDIAGANLIMSSAIKMRITSNGANKNLDRTILSFDDATGAITIDSPLPETPTVGHKVVIDEGVGSWNSFVRVLSSDLSSVVYSSLLTSAVNPVDGTGSGNNTELHGVWPVNDGVLVVGFHRDNDDDGTADGSPMPTDNVPSWGTATPTDETALLARLDFTPPTGGPVYADWSGSYNWQGESQTASGDDPDGDGLDNFTEYAIGSSPIDATAEHQPVLVKNGSNYDVRVHLGRDSSEVTYTVEFSTSLTPWSTFSSQQLSGSAGQSVDVTLPMSGSRCFARLKVSQ